MHKNIIDIVGSHFGKLTVISKSSSRNGRATWKCKCDCGKYSIVSGHSLQSGNTKSCGCLRYNVASNFIDLTNKKFGKLKVLSREESGGQRIMWKCVCDCGTQKIVCGADLKSGGTKSCGCSKREFLQARMRKRPFEWLYYKIKFVANQQNREFKLSYEDYLTFTTTNSCYYCKELVMWMPHFEKGNTCGYNLDRKNNEFGYTKENCVVCCSMCNHIKGNILNENEMIKVGRIISEIKQARMIK